MNGFLNFMHCFGTRCHETVSQVTLGVMKVGWFAYNDEGRLTNKGIWTRSELFSQKSVWMQERAAFHVLEFRFYPCMSVRQIPC